MPSSFTSCFEKQADEDGSPLKQNGSFCHKAETPSNFIGVVLKMVLSGFEENVKMFNSSDYIMMFFSIKLLEFIIIDSATYVKQEFYTSSKKQQFE